MNDQRFLFMGGLHRSGTTLLASLVGTNPQVAGFRQTGAPMDEGQYLQTVCPYDEQHGGPGRFAYTAEAHMTEHDALATSATARLLREQWARYLDPGRPTALEKSPPNMLRFRFFGRLFPGSRFVLVVRHPVAVAMSTRKWTPALTVRELVLHWLHAYDLAAADAAHLDHLLTVRYEELMADAPAVLDRIAAFAGIGSGFDVGDLDRGADERYLKAWRSGPGEADDLGDLAGRIAAHGYDVPVRSTFV
ncbi:sulfotransferase family protein [Paractinoplanes hotanensis]|uniref:Sulfotransferase n=1 Tax=Paractinoplanes hotanensis TaxID=2906497 RepID=A0ABT0Y6L3_9ACTN|nr:sulfotransferase [Actinoplanes hotanensis]MCM4081440.1 sulfotransferase [Actinoplanes hotanensis]